MYKKTFSIFVIIASIGLASALLNDRTLPNNLPSPDGRNISDLQRYDESNFIVISDLANQYTNENLNILYYKVIVPNDNDTQWNLSVQFAESKPYKVLVPIFSAGEVIQINPVSSNVPMHAWICCNVTKGDRLFTADATTNDTLRGTLTNLYNLNYKSRVYVLGTWYNYYVGASTIPDVYNRRAKLHIDGTQIAYAMETRNVTVAGVPELMKVFLI